MYKDISEYGIIGNQKTIALIALDGAIDWMCLPDIDSPSVFAALLDDENGGCFAIGPVREWDSTAAYIPDTNILVTKFRTGTGIMHLTDFMPVCLQGCGRATYEQNALYRCVEIVRGEMDVRVLFSPRFDYARAGTVLEKVEGGVAITGNRERMGLFCSRDLEVEEGRASAVWTLRKGDRVWFHLNYGEGPDLRMDPERDLANTETYWRTWVGKRETGETVRLGAYRDRVTRSALVLKLLYYEPEGTITAAATTSLPETIGGVRNWDYRYTWIRDTSFTLEALFKLGHLVETEGYLRWVERLISGRGAETLQIMYGIRGEEDLPETTLDHLDGYKGSRPVRIGNAASGQKQLDIYGELMNAALKLSDYVGKIDMTLWRSLCGICEYVVKHWREPDFGIWEVRGGPYSFVYSKVMCWVALDRGITIARRYGFPGNVDRWMETKDEIKKEVLSRGWNKKKASFVQHYDTDALDSSNLLIPLLGFLPVDDPRVLSTVEATRRELSHKGFLYRYTSGDGLPEGEGTFLLCTFWLIDCLIALGKLGDARTLLNQVERIANHVGLFPEEFDVNWGEALGNYPQAFTHIGYINSVVALCKREAAAEKTERKKTVGERIRRKILLTPKTALNDGSPSRTISAGQVVYQMKRLMNILRGAFFHTAEGRVAYEEMYDSEVFREYVDISYSLKNMDLNHLVTREEKSAFWINLYNVLVIHGVIELGIRDSVKEINRFFSRIRYQIGDLFFSPIDIEHGILRGNRRIPYSFFKAFGKTDPRLKFSIHPVDPRIHFGLVCASSSCPPIEVYTAQNIDEELTISAGTFLNTGGIKLNRKQNRVSLSRIFKWYEKDFGESQSELLKFVAPFVYDIEFREFIEKHADRLQIDYQDYDWRLNRT